MLQLPEVVAWRGKSLQDPQSASVESRRRPVVSGQLTANVLRRGGPLFYAVLP
jgi:hypothetical protein